MTKRVALTLVAACMAAAFLMGAKWEMDETAGEMLDSSGNQNNGTPTDVLQTGFAYVFNGVTSHVAVPDSDRLDPRGKPITLSALVQVTDKAMDDDSYDVVRKGLSGRKGGHYKMEIKRSSKDPDLGRLHCVFGGDKRTVKSLAKPDIVDGEFHTLECVKRWNSVVARVDGISSTTSGRAGYISNASNVLVGAKTINPLDDVFDGSMDYVRVDIAR